MRHYYRGYDIDEKNRILTCNGTFVVARCDSVSDAKATIDELIQDEEAAKEMERRLLYEVTH